MTSILWTIDMDLVPIDLVSTKFPPYMDKLQKQPLLKPHWYFRMQHLGCLHLRSKARKDFKHCVANLASFYINHTFNTQLGMCTEPPDPPRYRQPPNKGQKGISRCVHYSAVLLLYGPGKQPQKVLSQFKELPLFLKCSL